VTSQLPESNSTTLHLCHPTPDECVTIWTDISALWKDSLTLPVFLRESIFLAAAPLAKDGGMTQWILVDKDQPPTIAVSLPPAKASGSEASRATKMGIPRK
jgi:hypothetical protein